MTHENGTIGWLDLTVANAEEIRNFYENVIGWRSESVEMDGYDDFNMIPAHGANPTAGICHARGVNTDLPPVWMVYFIVANLDASLGVVRSQGGEVLKGPMGNAQYGRSAVIRDPAGAVCSLFERPSGSTPPEDEEANG